MFKTASAVILAILLSGCTDTPEQTVKDMYEGLQKGDLAKVIKNTTDPLSGAFAANALKKCSVDKKSYDSHLDLVNECLKETYSKLQLKSVELVSKSDNEAVVKVTVESDSVKNSTELNLVKVDGKWKASIKR